jgi:hypothetical protein
MPKERIIREQVADMQEHPLMPEELQMLKEKVYKRIMLYLPAYLLLLTGALIIYLNAPESFKAVVNRSADFNDEQTSRMWRLAPYVSLFVVVMATIFFGKIFYQSVLPILKDIKLKIKIIVLYKPQKNAMAVFNRYYISVPLFTMRQVQVEPTDFALISGTDEVSVELSKNSMIVLGIKIGGKAIQYYESVTKF